MEGEGGRRHQEEKAPLRTGPGKQEGCASPNLGRSERRGTSTRTGREQGGAARTAGGGGGDSARRGRKGGAPAEGQRKRSEDQRLTSGHRQLLVSAGRPEVNVGAPADCARARAPDSRMRLRQAGRVRPGAFMRGRAQVICQFLHCIFFLIEMPSSSYILSLSPFLRL